jgi:hypothetical protein
LRARRKFELNNKTNAKENLIGGDNEIEPRECEARARRKIEKLATTKSDTREREEKLEPCANKAFGSATEGDNWKIAGN